MKKYYCDVCGKELKEEYIYDMVAVMEFKKLFDNTPDQYGTNCDCCFDCSNILLKVLRNVVNDARELQKKSCQSAGDTKQD